MFECGVIKKVNRGSQVGFLWEVKWLYLTSYVAIMLQGLLLPGELLEILHQYWMWYSCNGVLLQLSFHQNLKNGDEFSPMSLIR